MIEMWSYLARDPLLWLSATLAAFLLGRVIFFQLGQMPLANPAMIAMLLLAGMLWLTGTSFDTYFEGAQFVHFLLGPATVCLALPLYDNLAKVRRAAVPILAALVVGSLVSLLSTLWIAHSFGFAPAILASMAPKAATAAVAIGIAEANGGLPSFTAMMVLATGLVGAACVTPLMNLMGIRDWRARGLAVGVAAHGIGTARALQVNPVAGAFAGLGMGLNALLTAILAPLVLRWFV